jgi:beta-phosphoglucomutase-like phosphatase (HAD superfamily)
VLLDWLKTRGLRSAVVSASHNCTAVLEAAGIAGRFDAQVGGDIADRLGLRGKPAPDTFLAAAEMLGAPASQCAVVEDALAGVEAGRAGDFALVVGVDRSGDGSLLSSHGADVVVRDLTELIGDAETGA